MSNALQAMSTPIAFSELQVITHVICQREGLHGCPHEYLVTLMWLFRIPSRVVIYKRFTERYHT